MSDLANTPFGWRLSFRAASSWIDKAIQQITERMDLIRDDPGSLKEFTEARKVCFALVDAQRALKK